MVTFFSIGRHYNYHRTLLLAGAVYERRGVGYGALFTQVFLGDKFILLMRMARRHTPSTITPTSLAVGGRPLEGAPCLGISCKLLVPPPSPPPGGGRKMAVEFISDIFSPEATTRTKRPGTTRTWAVSAFFGFRFSRLHVRHEVALMDGQTPGFTMKRDPGRFVMRRTYTATRITRRALLRAP